MKLYIVFFGLVAAASPAVAQEAWTGPYVGIHGGGGWGHVSITDTGSGVPPGPFTYDPSAWFGGATLGYNWQVGGYVLGTEADIGYFSPQGSVIIASSTPGQHQEGTLSGGAYGDVTGRFGITFDRALLYGKAGIAAFGGQAEQKTTKTDYASSPSGTFVGWTAGAGLEYLLTSSVSLKAEYQHFGLGASPAYQTSLVKDGVTPAGTRFYSYHNVGFDTVKVGLNFHF